MFKLTLFVLVSCSLILKAHGVTYRQIEADISNLFLVNQYSGNIYNTYNAKCIPPNNPGLAIGAYAYH